MFSQYLYQHQKSQIVSFDLDEANGEFIINLNKENLVTEGKELITKFLIILQTYKSSGAVERASKFYSHYSQVDDFFLKVRALVIEKKKPRRVEVFNNLVRSEESGAVSILQYPETFEGIIQSFADRYSASEVIATVLPEWDKTKHHLRV